MRSLERIVIRGLVVVNTTESTCVASTASENLEVNDLLENILLLLKFITKTKRDKDIFLFVSRVLSVRIFLFQLLAIRTVLFRQLFYSFARAPP